MVVNADYADFAARAEKFRGMHYSGETLLLPNAWDCVSARLFEHAGFPAVATTSAGVAWARGYADGEHIPAEVMLDAVSRIAAVTNVPVTADIEGGYYRNDPAAFVGFITALIRNGIVGINLEDGYNHTENLNSISQHSNLIAQVRAIGTELGVPIVINARTDAMVLSVSVQDRVAIAVERASAYAEAGADCIFIPFVPDITVVEQLRQHISHPINILITASLDFAELQRIGINRVSTGSRPHMAVLSYLRRLASELRHHSDPGILLSADVTYQELNSLFLM